MQQQTQLEETISQQLQPQQSQQPQLSQRQLNLTNPPVASPANLKAVNGHAPRRLKHRVAPRVRLRPNRQVRPQMKPGTSRQIKPRVSRQVSSQIKPRVTRVDPQAKIEHLKLEPAVQAGSKSKRPVKLKFSKAKSPKPVELQAVKKAKRPIIILEPALPVPVRAKIASQPRTSNKHPESLYSGKLLKDLSKIVKRKEELVVRTQDLITELCADLKKPWASYNRGSNISPNQLAKLLKLYGLKSQGVWLRGVGSFKGYNRKCLIKANKLTRSSTNGK